MDPAAEQMQYANQTRSKPTRRSAASELLSNISSYLDPAARAQREEAKGMQSLYITHINQLNMQLCDKDQQLEALRRELRTAEQGKNDVICELDHLRFEMRMMQLVGTRTSTGLPFSFSQPASGFHDIVIDHLPDLTSQPLSDCQPTDLSEHGSLDAGISGSVSFDCVTDKVDLQSGGGPAGF